MAVVPYILDDLDYYSEAYQTFTRCSAETGSIQDWIDSSFSNTVVSKLTAKFSNQGPLKILGVGSGAGNLDCSMLEKLLPSFPQIENTIVEPSEAQVELFKKNIEEKGDQLKGATFDWRLETSDQYLDAATGEGKTPPKFHLITAVHVLYYARDLQQSLKALHSMLEEGGLLFIINLSRKSTINKIHRKMNAIQENSRTLLLTDEQVGAALDAVNLPYTTETIVRYIQGTAIFDEGSEEGRHLLDFLTHSKDFRKNASDELREGILQYMRDPECSLEKDGKISVFRTWVYMTITK